MCWEAERLGLNTWSPNTCLGIVDSITLIDLLKLWVPLPDRRAAAESPHEQDTLWRGKLKNYTPS